MDDEDLLAILADERKRSIGFDHDSELSGEREKALNYIKGEMTDVPSMPNRSKAVSTDVSDAIETLLPDLVEIFTGGDDVATFIPRGPEDEQAAKQETDYLQYVVFQENDGFLNLYTLFKDALTVKTGVAKFWWKEGDEETETLEGKTRDEVALLAHNSELISYEPAKDQPDEPVLGPDGQPLQLYDVVVKKPGSDGRVCIKAFPPEDFTVAPDTVLLSEATYCAARYRPRAQELIAQGISRDIVDQLPAYGTPHDDSISQARDEAGESDNPRGGGIRDMRQVEILEHFVRLEEGGKLQLWRVVTGGGETVLIEKERVSRVQFAAITPYVITHRFYGRSVADLLMDLQRINTAITRGYLDSIYFALNQRLEVDMGGANEFTISDLLRNEPGVPIRVNRAGAVTPIQAGGAGFNGLEALEYFQTKAEQRTGIVRNAQGLNPDTLHETAQGAMALIAASQKRVRLIARIFAETGIKDLFLGVHALLREHASQQVQVRLRGNWTPVDPSTWGNRADMSIEIGVGSGGKQAELQQITAEMNVVKEIITLQGGEGPIVTWANLYALAKRFFEKGGCKAPEAYLSDPSSQEMQQVQQAKAQQPNPELMKVQAQIQGDQAKAQASAQIEQMKAQAKMQLDQQSAQHDLQLQAQRNQLDLELAQRKHDAEWQLKQQEAALTAQLKAREQEFEMQLAARRQANEERANVSGATFGGENP